MKNALICPITLPKGSISQESVPPIRVYQGISRSLHFIRRAEERGLKEDVLELILTFGTEFHRAGALHLTLLEKCLPKALRNSPLARKARDWVVLFTEGEKCLTCYRRKNAAKYLKRKSQRRLSESQLTSRHGKTHRPDSRRISA